MAIPEKWVQLLPVAENSSGDSIPKILLCKWKDGDYVDRFTGFIGPVDDNVDENLESAMERVVASILPHDAKLILEKKELRAILTFDGPPETLEYQYVGYVPEQCAQTLTNLISTDKCSFQWFSLNKIPFEEMPADDRLWYPGVLEGKKYKGGFVFGGHAERTIKSYELNEVDHLESS